MTSQSPEKSIQENMASRTRHDLLQPTAAMKILLSRLKDPIEDAERLEIVNALLRAIDDLDEAVSVICDYLMLSNGLGHCEPKTVLVKSWLDDCAVPFIAAAGSSNLELSVNCSVDEAFFDPKLCGRIISAFLSNAIDFSQTGRIALWASLTPDEKYLEICVSDCGVGLAQEAEPHIMKPFFVDQAHLSRRPPRLGLGLTIAQEAAQLMGGSISVKPSSTGKGVIAMLQTPMKGA